MRRGSRGGARVQAPSAVVAATYSGLLLQYRGTSIADIYEARNVIERPLVRILGERASRQHLDTLLDIARREQEVIDSPDTVTSLQTSFHQAVADYSGNKTLQLFESVILTFVEVAGVESITKASGTASQRAATHRGSSAHRRVVELLLEGNIEEADRVWMAHLDESRDFVLNSSIASNLLEMSL